jgi:hypothetical protein
LFPRLPTIAGHCIRVRVKLGSSGLNIELLSLVVGRCWSVDPKASPGPLPRRIPARAQASPIMEMAHPTTVAPAYSHATPPLPPTFSAARLASRIRKVGGMPARDERVGQEHEGVFKLIVRLAGELGAVDVGERCPQEFGLGTAIRTHPGVAIGCPVRTRVDREAGHRGEPAVLAVACAWGRCTTPSGVFSYGRIAQTLQSRV